MCTGLEIAALVASTGLSVGGQAMAANEQQKNNERQARARNEELAAAQTRNKQLSQDATNILDKRIDQTAPEVQQQKTQDVQSQLVDSLAAAANTPKVESSISGSAPEVVKTEMAKRLGDSLGVAKTNAQNLGKLGTYNQTMFNNDMATKKAGQAIDLPVSLARSNMDILPGLQDLAQISANKPGSGLGQVLQGLGSLGANVAGSGYLQGAPKGLNNPLSSGWSSTPTGIH